MPWNGYSLSCGVSNATWTQLTAWSVQCWSSSKSAFQLAPATLKVFVSTISTSHEPLDGASVGRHPLVYRFFCGARWLRPICWPQIPSWHLWMVLGALEEAPFEPLCPFNSVSEKIMTLKVALLLALTSFKRVGDLQALSVASSCSDFAPWMVKVILHPRPDYTFKVPSAVGHPVILQAFFPPPQEC